MHRSEGQKDNLQFLHDVCLIAQLRWHGFLCLYAPTPLLRKLEVYVVLHLN